MKFIYTLFVLVSTLALTYAQIQASPEIVHVATPSLQTPSSSATVLHPSLSSSSSEESEQANSEQSSTVGSSPTWSWEVPSFTSILPSNQLSRNEESETKVEILEKESDDDGGVQMQQRQPTYVRFGQESRTNTMRNMMGEGHKASDVAKEKTEEERSIKLKLKVKREPINEEESNESEKEEEEQPEVEETEIKHKTPKKSRKIQAKKLKQSNVESESESEFQNRINEGNQLREPIGSEESENLEEEKGKFGPRFTRQVPHYGIESQRRVGLRRGLGRRGGIGMRSRGFGSFPRFGGHYPREVLEFNRATIMSRCNFSNPRSQERCEFVRAKALKALHENDLSMMYAKLSIAENQLEALNSYLDHVKNQQLLASFRSRPTLQKRLTAMNDLALKLHSFLTKKMDQLVNGIQKFEKQNEEMKSGLSSITSQRLLAHRYE